MWKLNVKPINGMFQMFRDEGKKEITLGVHRESFHFHARHLVYEAPVQKEAVLRLQAFYERV